MVTRLTRQGLYDMVWDRPMTTLAKEFSLSDVALHKICRKHDVPTPPAGYWAKKAHRKPVRVTPLPRSKHTADILIYGGASAQETEAIAAARAATRTKLSEAKPTPLAPNPIVERTMAALERATPGRDGLVRSDKPGQVTMALRPDCLERASTILRDLADAAERAGIKLVNGEGGADWHCNGQTIAFELVEATDQVEHVATEAELAAVAKWQRERDATFKRTGYLQSWGDPKIPKWEQRHQGRLKISLEEVRIKGTGNWWGSAIRRSFADSAKRDVATAIPRIVETIAAMAAAKIGNDTFDEQQRLEREAAERARAEAERRRQLEQQSLAFLEQLLDEQGKLEQLGTTIDRLTRSGLPLPPRTAQLLAWLRARAAAMEERLEPLAVENRLEAAGLLDQAGEG